MGIQENKYSVDEQHRTKDSPLMRIISTIAFGGIGLLFVFMILIYFKSFPVAIAVVITFGFIILTIWLKSMYVHRYLIPGIVIIAVFLAYPLIYTVYIAFTNFGTGHMETRDGLRNYLLTSMFYDSAEDSAESLYAEIYINKGTQKELSHFLESEYNNYLSKKKASSMGEFTDDDEWDAYIEFFDLDNGDSPIHKLLKKSKFSRLRKSDLTLILYNKKEVNEADKEVKAFYFVPTKNFKEIGLDEVNSFTLDKGLILISSAIYNRKGVSELDELLDPYLGEILRGESVIVTDDVTKKKTVFSFLDGTVFANRKPLYIDPKKPVDNPVVAQIKKLDASQITSKDGNVLLKLVKNTKTGNLEYSKKVFEDTSQGNYVETRNDQPIKYWKEYYVRPNIMKFTYGSFTLDNNPGIEQFLAKIIMGYTRRLKDILSIIEDSVKEDFDKSLLEEYINKKIDVYNSDPVLDYVDYNRIYDETINEAMNLVASSIVVKQPKKIRGKNVTPIDKNQLIADYTKIVKTAFTNKLKTPICLDEEVGNIITYDDIVCYKPKSSVNNDDVEKLKNQIKDANNIVHAFNKKINTIFKNEYILFAKVKALNEVFNSNDFPLNNSDNNLIDETKYKFVAVNDSGKVMIQVYAADDPTILLDSIKDSQFKKYLSNTLKVNRGLIRAVGKKISKSLNKNVSYKIPQIVSLKFKTVKESNISSVIDKGFSVWVGFKNFTKIVTTPNITTPFFNVFIWTILWALGSVLFSFAVGLALALLFNSSDFRFRTIYRTILILPWSIPAFVSILMWAGLLNKDFGVINQMFHIDVNWLGDQRAWGALPKISTLLVNLWLSFPYFMVISLGALQSIDKSLYEVADVDGATKFQQFRMITLPLLLIAIGPMLVGSFAFSFNNFAGIYLLTGGGPVMRAGILPGHTDILISYTYKLAFGAQNKDYGLASAIAIFVFLIIGTITFLNFKWTGTFKEVENA